MTDELVFCVSIPDPAEARAALEKARFEFECLLDYVAANHPQVLTDDLGTSLMHDMGDHISYVWHKYGLVCDQ